MGNPLVSVIIPVYNTEKYLQRCIDSLLAQTYSNLEFLFVNDGSKDNSIQVLREAVKSESRIRFFSQDNRGLSGARNTGMREAHGEFFLFCDSDDTVEPDWAARLLEVAQKHPDSLVVCGIRHIDDRNHSSSLSFVREGEYAKEQYYDLIRPGMAGSVCIKIFSRSIIEQNQLTFDETVRYAEDVVFTLDYLHCVGSIYIIEDALYDYFHYERNTHSTITQDITYSQMRYIFDRRLPFIVQEHVDDYKQMFFGNLWERFLSLLGRRELSSCDRFKEAKEILDDSVFREYLSKHGIKMFDPMSLRLLKHRNAQGYYLWQQLHRCKLKGLSAKPRENR